MAAPFSPEFKPLPFTFTCPVRLATCDFHVIITLSHGQLLLVESSDG